MVWRRSVRLCAVFRIIFRRKQHLTGRWEVRLVELIPQLSLPVAARPHIEGVVAVQLSRMGQILHSHPMILKRRITCLEIIKLSRLMIPFRYPYSSLYRELRVLDNTWHPDMFDHMNPYSL